MLETRKTNKLLHHHHQTALIKELLDILLTVTMHASSPLPQLMTSRPTTVLMPCNVLEQELTRKDLPQVQDLLTKQLPKKQRKLKVTQVVKVHVKELLLSKMLQVP
jgi:hypothetical protein